MLARRAACIPAAITRAATAVAFARLQCLRVTASATSTAVAAPLSTSTHVAHNEHTAATAIPSGHPHVRGINTSAPLHAVQESTVVSDAARTLFARLEGGELASEVKVEVPANAYIADLKEKVAKGLSLEGTPLRDITLHLETADGATIPLAGRQKVADLDAEASIVVKVAPTTKPTAASTISAGVHGVTLPSFPALPSPIVFEHTTIDDQDWFATDIVLQSGVSAPVFLTAAQHAELVRFINERPSTREQALMPVGTIKSGKSTILEKLLPGMIAAAVATRWPSARMRPVLFNYKFPLGRDAEGAAMHFSRALHNFGQRINVPFKPEATGGDALDNLPTNIRDFAELISNRGGELWLLLDELQGPCLGSTPAMVQHFTHMFKEIVRLVSPLGRIVATGSGLVTLLNSFRTAHTDGFALWDAVSFLGVGHEPSMTAVQSIAAAIHPPYTADWPPAAKCAITPAALVDALRFDAHGNLTSLRPALLAYTLGRMGDAKSGTPDEVLSAAVGAALGKLHAESTRDTLVGLVALHSEERRVLRQVATGGFTVAELDAIKAAKGKLKFKGANVGVQPDKLASLITCLCEDGTGSDIVRLQPPYSILLESWIRANGELAVAVHNDKIELDHDTRMNLIFVAEPEQRKVVETAGLRGAVGRAFMQSLASNGVGVRQADGTVRAPKTAAEFDAIPALQGLESMLSASYLAGFSKRQPSLSAALRKAATAAGAAPSHGAPFEEVIGWELWLACRHFLAHIWADAACLVRNGLTASVIADAVYAAARVLADPVHGCFRFVGSRLLPKP